MEHNHPVTLWYDLVVVLHMLTASLSLSHSLSLSFSFCFSRPLIVCEMSPSVRVGLCIYTHLDVFIFVFLRAGFLYTSRHTHVKVVNKSRQTPHCCET